MADVLGRDSENEDEDDDSSGSEEAATDSDDLAANLDPDMPGPRLRKGTGRIFPAKFVPPSASVTPSELFIGQKKHGLNTRQVNAQPQPMQMLQAS
jgi:ribonuclease HI